MAKTIDETQYDEIFISKFKVNSVELKNEFKRVINEYGYSEKTKLEFYCQVFDTVISQFKKEVAKDENYDYIISTLYQLFIDTLEKDSIDGSKFKKNLQQFKTTELLKYSIPKKIAPSEYKPVSKTYNLNTKYGRRKAREQAQKHYNELPPDKKVEHNVIGIIIIIIICLIMWLLLGTDGFLKWASH